MKRILLTMLALTLMGYFVFKMYGFASGVQQDAAKNMTLQQADTGIYYIELPTGLDTMKFEANISLDATKKFQRIKFPNGGTGTTVFIYDSTYLETMQSNTSQEAKPLAEGNFANDQEVLLDITKLNSGKYYVHYLSCNLGGIFPLTIR